MEQPDDYASTAGSRSYDEDEDSHDAFEEYDTAGIAPCSSVAFLFILSFC